MKNLLNIIYTFTPIMTSWTIRRNYDHLYPDYNLWKAQYTSKSTTMFYRDWLAYRQFHNCSLSLEKGNTYVTDPADQQKVEKKQTLQQRLENELKLRESFKLPKVNEKENLKKFSAAISLVKLFLKTNLPQDVRKAMLPVSQVIQSVETLYRSDPRSFPTISKMYGSWLKASYLSGDFSQRDIPDGFWSSFFKCPNIFIPIWTFLKKPGSAGSNLIFRVCMSVLNCYKVTVIPKVTDLSTVVDGYGTGVGLYDSLKLTEKEYSEVFTSLGLNCDQLSADLKQNILESKWHFTNASGPNGNAIWSSHIDALAVREDNMLFSNLKEWCKLTNSEYIIDAIESASVSPELIRNYPGLEPKHSKLHFLYEKGDKCRVIAILDYFSQEALTHVHKTIADFLRKLKTDHTFNQGLGFLRVLDWSAEEGRSLYSYDLSAATDRLPIALQMEIMCKIFGDDIGVAWANLINGREWWTPYGYKVNYGVGQPMGAKSSFPLLALTHHFIVKLAAIRIGKTQFNDYAILGDDIVIGDKAVADKYLELMNLLKVQVNLNKSIIAVNKSLRGAEFASRLCLNGVDLTPLPVKLFSKVFENADYLPQLQNELVRVMGDSIEPETFWNFLVSFGRQNDLLGLMKLNGLPLHLSGLNRSFLLPEARDIGFEAVSRMYNISETDLENFFNFVVLTDQFKRIDALLKDSTTTLQAILSWSKADGYKPIGLQKSNMKLEDYISELIAVLDEKYFHPAQEIARSEGNRLADILSKFMLVDRDVIKELRKGIIQSIRVKLDEKSLVMGHMRDPEVVNNYQRRLLDRALRLLLTTASLDSGRVIKQNIFISSLKQNWLITVAIGEHLVISPIGISMDMTASQLEDKIKNTFSGKTLAQTLYSATPDRRRLFHPEGRLTADKGWSNDD